MKKEQKHILKPKTFILREVQTPCQRKEKKLFVKDYAQYS